MNPQRRALVRPTRRAVFLAAALLAPATAAPPARAADPYDTLRRRWLGIALGTGYDPAGQPEAARLAATGALPPRLPATLPPARVPPPPTPPPPPPRGPGQPDAPPAAIARSNGRLWTMTRPYVQPATG